MIMKKIYILTLCCMLTVFSGCKKFVDVNQNPNSPTNVSEALILTPLQVSISSSLFAGNVSNIVLQYMQVMALNQTYPNAGTYLMYNTDINGDWINVYTTELNNLTVLTAKATANGNFKYAGISKILTAYTLGTATDLWGDIPYSEAFQGVGKLQPKYDAQKDIYETIQGLLDGAIADIAKNSGTSPAADDLYFGGNMAKWTKLAYTLKARYYMHLTKAPGYTAVAQSQLALTALANGMTSTDDDLKLAYTGAAGTENPWQQNFISASTIILSSTFVNGFTNRNDPRLTKMVAPATQTGLYTGRVIGTEGIGSLESYSRPSAYYAGASASTYLVTYEEALFLKAEATFRVSGLAAATPIYQAGVSSHMSRLGVTTAASSAYLTTRALTTGNALQLIIEEKGTANFLSMETWTDWRRTGYPPLTKVLNALSEIPRRILYPQVEQVANPQAIQSAKLTDRVWWDAQ
jgi:hypothetical protein